MIATERLILRPMTERDLVRLAHALNNFRISRNTSRIPWPYRLDDASEYLDRLRALGSGSLWLAISHRAEPSGIAGGIGYSAGVAGHAAEIGYWLDEPYWAMGYGFEAASAIVNHAFNSTGLERLVASHHHGNGASRRILDRLGFRFTHHALTYSRAWGHRVPTAFMELSKSEWLRTPC